MCLTTHNTPDHAARSAEDVELQAQPHLAAGMCHGVLGELWQGPVDGSVAVVSLPVPGFSRAVLSPSDKPEDCSVPLTPLRYAAVQAFQERYPDARLPHGVWSFDSDLAVGHGMASSTADIVAVLRCLASATGTALSDTGVVEILRTLERSDPVFRPRVCLYKTAKHELVEEFDSDITFHACYALGPAGVETRCIEEDVLLRAYRRYAGAYSDSLKRIRQALRARDLSAIAEESTRSALLAQAYLPNPVVDELSRDFTNLGALGLARAHTGSIVSLLFGTPLSIADKEKLSQYFHQRNLTAQFKEVGSHGA